MANKTWTATDLQLGKLTIHRLENELQLERRYKFLDAQGDVLEQIASRRVLESVPIAGIPQNILVALQAIDQWTKRKALEQEGMQ